MIRSIDHVAIAVNDADSSMCYYRDVLGLELVGDEVADDPGVRLVYLAAGQDTVQLVQPLRPGPVRTWIDEHGEGLHHICFEVRDIPHFLSVTDGQKDRPVFRGGRHRRACFLGDTPEGVNIELTETEASW